MPSPDPEHPGLLIRDPLQFSDSVLLVPVPLVASLACFDGEQTELDLRQSLVQATGEIQVGPLEKNLVDSLSEAGFLEDERFSEIRKQRIQEFENSPVREPVHAGQAYPETEPRLRTEWDGYMADGASNQAADLIGIAAPHVSPFGGWESYRDAYKPLVTELRDRTFVILGTSHYGAPERFGLTRKPFVTPFGTAHTDVDLVNRMETTGGAAVHMEDYCHAIEHSIEFQVLFLQYLFGPSIRILPILCGPFAESLYGSGMPEDNSGVERFLGALGELNAREAQKLFWVLGVDMAHIGRRYGDALNAVADRGEMADIGEKDQARIAQINQGDAHGFWNLVQEGHDPLKWCGASPLYTFLKAVPEVRGTLERYQQWNIDENSVVSFGALGFRK